jgi:hypothetical protein
MVRAKVPGECLLEERFFSVFGVIEFRGCTGLFPENVVDVFKSLFEHLNLNRCAKDLLKDDGPQNSTASAPVSNPVN